MSKTNFELYLEQQLKDPEFALRFEEAGAGWDVALKLAALRQEAGLTQKELAQRLRTSQQSVSRMESPEYTGHSLTLLRRIADELGVRVCVSFEPKSDDATGGAPQKQSRPVVRKPAGRADAQPHGAQG